MQLFTNNISAVVDTGINATDTSLILIDASDMPSPTGGDFFLLTLFSLNANGQEDTWEIIKVTARTANTLTIVRAQEGTTGLVWTSASTCQLRVTAGTLSAKADLAHNTFTGVQIYSDQQASRALFLDIGLVSVAKGNSGTSTQTYDYTAGGVQTSTATGNHTIAVSNWPPTGNLGELLIIGTNFGAFTITWPTINWILPDGTTTTVIATWLAAITNRPAFQASGVDQIRLWSIDAGTTIYGDFFA